MNQKQIRAAVEAMLFAYGEPLSAARMAQALESDEETITRVLRDMARDYPRHYQLLSRRLFGRVLTMPGPLGRWITLGVYGLSRKIFGFN